MSSIGGCVRVRAPRRMLVKDICCEVASRRASASVAGGDDVDADHRVRRSELRRRLEAPAIDGQRRVELLRREVRREREREPELSRELGAEEAGSEDVDGHFSAGSGHRLDPLPRLDRRQEGLELEDVLREVLGVRRQAAKRRQRLLIGAGRAAEAQIDAPGKQRGQGAELFGDHVRRVVGQHDAAGADADGRRPGGEVRDHERRRGGRHRRHVVVLRHPDAAEPQRLDATSHLARLVEGTPAGAVLANAAELEHRERNHCREAA